MDENCSENLNLNFQRPEATLKLKVKKRRSSCADRVLKPINLGPRQDVVKTKGHKRSNPFSCTPGKKANISTETRKTDSFLFKALDKVNGEDYEDNIDEQPLNKREFNSSVLNDIGSSFILSDDREKSNLKFTLSKTSNAKDSYDETSDGEGELHFPIDWSVKTRLRFTSSQSFSWCNPLKTKEESKGLAMFVRCTDASEKSRSAFQKETMVWTHPSLPWVNLFPRNSQERNKQGKKPIFTGIQDTEILESLHQHWTTSFRSVFNLLRSGYCPYFYLCANQCTMVFKAAGITEKSDVEVIISPTTKGMREALGKEGITCTMPHLNSICRKQDSSSSSSCKENVQERNDNSGESDCDSDEESDWLDSMGLERLKKQFPGLRPDKMTRSQMSALRTLDQHPSSTVSIQGTADTQALFNYLLNCKSLIPPSGPLAGIPPTLLAPVAFDGATLQTLKVHQGVIKHQQINGFEDVHSLEITGPILPSCMYGLCELLKDTQSGNYTVTATPYQHSIAFNMKCATTNNNQMNTINLKSEQFHSSCGLVLSQVEYHKQFPVLSKSFLKDLSCKNGLYSWCTS